MWMGSTGCLVNALVVAVKSQRDGAQEVAGAGPHRLPPCPLLRRSRGQGQRRPASPKSQATAPEPRCSTAKTPDARLPHHEHHGGTVVPAITTCRSITRRAELPQHGLPTTPSLLPWSPTSTCVPRTAERRMPPSHASIVVEETYF